MQYSSVNIRKEETRMTQAVKTQKSLPIRIVQGILKAIQECMVPVIPMIMAGGLVKVLVIISS